MSSFSAIDLSQLPVPQVLDDVSFEIVLADMVERYSVLVPELAASIALESDPIRKLLQIAAYESTLLRARINNSAKAVMLAHAQGSDLDHLAALIPLTRQVGEADERFRSRIRLSPEGFSTAGPIGGYIAHAQGADAAVRDAFIDTYDVGRDAPNDPQPGDVHVYVLASEDGVLSPSVEAKVLAAVNDQEVRPLTDRVSVKAPVIVPYAITAALSIGVGPDPEIVREAALVAAQAFIDANLRIGGNVFLSALTAALVVPGVVNAVLAAPENDIEVADNAVAICTALTLTIAGTEE